MININKYKNLNLDKNLTSNLILKSFIFNIFYFTIFKLYKNWKKKNSNASNFDYLFLNVLQIKIIGSNHYRRRNLGLNFIVKIISKLFFWKIIRNNSLICLLRKNPIEQYKADYIIKNHQEITFNDQIVFCGDSHVEFLSRINFIGSFWKKIKPISIWLGPRTLIGFAADKKIQNWLFEVIKRIQNNNDKKTFYIIFSMGSIDIRTSIGYLLKSKSINSEQDFFDIFERSYIAFYQSMLNNYKENNNIKIAFLSIPPASPIEGFDINKSEQKNILELKNNSEFKIYGTPKQRSLWTKHLNIRLEKLSKEKGWNFINNEKAYQNIKLEDNYIFDMKCSFDNIHLSNSRLFADTLNNIISYFDDNK
jgi:hypothetical protein